MSTEHQQYSTDNQREAIRKYAEGRNMVIVRTYTDSGKSGLRIDGRDALKQLLLDVPNNDFDVILVYDVSRWGRFQDADESAYYEYICRREEIEVHYCAEQFENDGSPVSTIVKSVKRAMAGEYSRELSAKVFVGQCRLVELGYRQGGSAGFGLRRMLRDVTGQHKGLLGQGEEKSIATDRVILVRGPQDEIDIVRWLYRAFADQNLSELQLATSLNARGIKTDLGRAWTSCTVHQILTNEKYIGNNVFNKKSFKLKKKRVVNTPDMWVRGNFDFEPIVSSELHARVQRIVYDRCRKFTDEELIDHLRKLLRREGRLSGPLIDAEADMATSYVYRRRFGGLVQAYKLLSYEPESDCRYVETSRQLRRMRPRIVSESIEIIRQLGGTVTRASTEIFNVNGEFTVSVVIARCTRSQSGAFQWRIRLDAKSRPDITLAVRMDADNREPLDYYLLPSMVFKVGRIRLAGENALSLDMYRFSTLEFLFGMAKRAHVTEAA
jgi:DNA invertase Pin-like site-specific DNA recombinase